MDYIQAVKDRLNILDLVRRMGIPIYRNNFIKSIYKKSDNTPSLKLYPDNRDSCFKCYATGKHGDIIQFYQDYYKIDTATAIKELCAYANIPFSSSGIIRTPSPRKTYTIKFKDLFDANLLECMSEDEQYIFWEKVGMVCDNPPDSEVEFTEELKSKIDNIIANALKPVRLFRLQKNIEIFEELYQYCKSDGDDERIIKYLIDERKLNYNVLERFRIFTIKNYYKVNNHLKKKFAIPDLQRSGLFNLNGNLMFFKHRLMLPYLHKGAIVYLRARYFDQKGNATCTGEKYLGLRNDKLNLNHPKRFYNSDILNDLLDGQNIYITEGEIDTLTLEGEGINCVCIPGAGNIPENRILIKLKRLYPIITVDNDLAGTQLMGKLIEKFKQMKMSFELKYLPVKDVNALKVNNG